MWLLTLHLVSGLERPATLLPPLSAKEHAELMLRDPVVQLVAITDREQLTYAGGCVDDSRPLR